MRVPVEKTLLYQLLVSAPMLALGAEVLGERVTEIPSGIALGSLAYQTLWITAVTYLAWFALIQRYSASRLSVFTFLTPLFGVAAGHIVLGRAVDARVCGGGDAGGRRSRPGEPATLTAAAHSGTSLPRRFDNVQTFLQLRNRALAAKEPKMSEAGPQQRRRSVAVDVGGVPVGGGAPIVVQSMTNTDTADVEGTARQVAALARAGSELVRITVDRDEAAAAVPHIKERLLGMGVEVPIVGDFHYIGHKLLADHPACAEALDKYRINPGNVGFKDKKDRQFGAIVETAIRHGKPVRIGANWGSLDQELLTRLMDENARSPTPLDARAVTREAMVQSAMLSAQRAEEIGLARDRIILSAKVSAVQDLIAVYHGARAALGLRAASRPHRGRHGLEGDRRVLGRAQRPAAAGHRRHHPDFAHARARRRPHPRGQGRAGDPADDGLSRVRAAGRGLSGLRPHDLHDISGAGRATSRPSFTNRCRNGSAAIPGVETLNVAVMGCIVNGPGESKHADIGISLPGTGEQPAAPVFIDGKKVADAARCHGRGRLQAMVIEYIERRFGEGGAGRTAAE